MFHLKVHYCDLRYAKIGIGSQYGLAKKSLKETTIDKSEFVDIFLLEHSVETVVLIIRQ